MKKVIVVGGGAAGMMAALAASENGNQVYLYEKNDKLGKKLFITGKGRCNVTNSCDMDELLQNVVSNPKFLYSAFYGFDNRQVCELFENAGCRLKTERGNRVFPVSDHSSDIIKALQNMLRAKGVDIYLQTAVKEIVTKRTDEKTHIVGIKLQDGSEKLADAVIVATGGISYESTGSTGDGYQFALHAGHEMVTPKPSLVPLETAESFCKELMGLTLKNVRVTLTCNGRE
ncbi:MAG TPA: aminoacetone oxidase family FAD-binding enzyme, partial [Lachnospiraceae bacterium]|nr:aminoacetone oxidase family FAD-binding enzyme [Lachnospiraceae bacterium]